MSIVPTNVVPPPSVGIGLLADGIAVAEGVASSANNPGALALGDLGNGTFNSAGVSIYASPADGVNALYNQLTLVANGLSAHENTSMTITQFAVAWTGNDNPTSWANNVASTIGVPVTTTIGTILGATPATPETDTEDFASDASTTSSTVDDTATTSWDWQTIALIAAAGLVGLFLLTSD